MQKIAFAVLAALLLAGCSHSSRFDDANGNPIDIRPPAQINDWTLIPPAKN